MVSDKPGAIHSDAASQLHQTGRSCFAQHFPCVYGGSADFAADVQHYRDNPSSYADLNAIALLL